MYKLIQKNQKKFLAFFGVLLMIVFILPTSFKNSATRGENAIGTLYGEKIYGRDLAQAKNDVELLREFNFTPFLTLGGDRQQSIAAEFRHGDDGALAYLLLQKEAQKAGISISDQDVESLIDQSYPKGQLTPSEIGDITHAVGRFMLVQAGFERASDAVKATKPLLQYWLAQVYQGETLNLAEYRADEFAKSVPEPTPEQIRQQYEKYADVLPDPPAPGYKVPDRVKLQYLELPKSAVVQSVLNDLSKEEKYDLDIQGAYPYYEQHLEEFKAPPPSLVLGPSTQPTPPAPTTRPFDAAVALEVEKRLVSNPALSSVDPVVALRARVEAREKVLRAALRDELASAYLDWAAQTAGSATAPSVTQPAVPAANPLTNPIAPAYPDLDFLTALATRFEIKYKVRPLVNSLANKWLTTEELNGLPGIGSARIGPTPFAEFAMHDLAAAPSTQPGSTTSAMTLPAQATTVPTTDAATTLPAAPATTIATTSPARPAGRRFTIEDFARVDPEMANLLKARGAAKQLYDTLAAQLGPANAAVQTAKAALDAQTARMQTYADQLNGRSAIRWNADGTGGALIPRGLPDTMPVAQIAAPTASWTPVGTGLRPFEPSPVLDDASGNAYVFRLTAFEPAHRPPLAAVEPQIIAQLKSDAAMQRARDEAKKLLTNAQIEARLRKEKKAADLQGLPAAARASGRTLIITKSFQPISLSIDRPVPGYDPTDLEDKEAFFKAVVALCKQQTPGNLHPSAVIDLPREQKVVVAEVGDPVLPMPPEEVYAYMAPSTKNNLIAGRFFGVTSSASSMLHDWFNLDNIISRVKYEKTSKG